jgi:four helix bundle protein
MRDHTKLCAFELADQLAIAMYEATSGFPRAEMFGLTAQLRRGVVSIASNIVEGCARFSEAEYLHFLDMAYCSARELEYQIGLAHGLGFLSDAAHRDLSGRSTETAEVLNGLLRSLRRQQQVCSLQSPACSLFASVDQSVRLEAGDQEGVQRLIEYFLRCPFS